MLSPEAGLLFPHRLAAELSGLTSMLSRLTIYENHAVIYEKATS